MLTDDDDDDDDDDDEHAPTVAAGMAEEEEEEKDKSSERRETGAAVDVESPRESGASSSSRVRSLLAPRKPRKASKPSPGRIASTLFATPSLVAPVMVAWW